MSKRADFDGFSEGESFTALPDSFFQRVLQTIVDLDELKVTLYALWRFTKMEGTIHSLREADFDLNMIGLGAGDLQAGLDKAVKRGSLLTAEQGGQSFFFLNSPRGRAAAAAFGKGQLDSESVPTASSAAERPNLFSLYEQNIGPLTPMIADFLTDSEKTYEPAWIEDAITEAVLNNKRNWKYIDAILKRWKEDGRAKKQTRRVTQAGRWKDYDRKIEELRKRSRK